MCCAARREGSLGLRVSRGLIAGARDARASKCVRIPVSLDARGGAQNGRAHTCAPQRDKRGTGEARQPVATGRRGAKENLASPEPGVAEGAKARRCGTQKHEGCRERAHGRRSKLHRGGTRDWENRPPSATRGLSGRYAGERLNSPTVRPCEILRRGCHELHERLRNSLWKFPNTEHLQKLPLLPVTYSRVITENPESTRK